MRLETFNCTPIEEGLRVPFISQKEIIATPGMLNASLGDAMLYGGDAVRSALSAVLLEDTYKHVVVDVKTHMLMPGMVPAIPGWHTDGVPRSESGAPFGKLAPDLRRQHDRRSPTYHLFLAGCDAPTVFLKDRFVDIDVPDNDPALYAHLTDRLNENTWSERVEIPNHVWWTWDWWELHSAQPAREKGWRMLIRVTESDFVAPEPDLRKVLRTQQQAYINGSFGW